MWCVIRSFISVLSSTTGFIPEILGLIVRLVTSLLIAFVVALLINILDGRARFWEELLEMILEHGEKLEAWIVGTTVLVGVFYTVQRWPLLSVGYFACGVIFLIEFI